MDLDFPKDFFGPPPKRSDNWPDHPDLRCAVDWFRSFIPEAEWRVRREAAVRRLYQAALGQIEDQADKGLFYVERDTFGWYLFLADAYLDHVWNYEPIWGCRVVPVLIAIGRDLPLLRDIAGIEGRARRLVGPEKSQPNGILFELLVGAAYRRAGAEVELLEERPGKARTCEMLVRLHGRTWAVECKRMETGQYAEHERCRMRELWGPSSAGLLGMNRSVFCDARFDVEIADVPTHYLTDKVWEWLASERPSLLWNDAIGNGVVGDLDLEPLRTVLATDNVLGASSRILQLLTGRYIRNANYVTATRMQPGGNPRYIGDCDLAVVLRWKTMSRLAIDRKARDIIEKLAEANDQLPDDMPGIVHVGFEAVEGDDVERARYDKIMTTANRFDPRGKRLEYVYCHYFVPEQPPDQSWAYDETTQRCAVRPQAPPPLNKVFLVSPDESRPGPHWQL
jgi:hypothetical protein